MSPNGKWLEGVAPNADVADAARQALSERLAAVVYWLPPAAYCANLDIEHVHRLRVSTRRAMAAWRLFHTWLLSKRAKTVRKWLRRIRRSAGEARDLDVLMDRLRREFGDDAENAIAFIKREREAVQPDIVRVADRARKSDRFSRDVDRLIQGIESCCNKRACDECAPFRKWSERQLADLSKKFFRDLPGEGSSSESLHKFRIRSKALRYGLELVAPVLGGGLREVQYPVVEEIQERLGAINDHATAAARFEQWANKEKSAELKSVFSELAQSERQRMESEAREFHGWWTAERVESLRRGLMSNGTSDRERTVLAY